MALPVAVQVYSVRNEAEADLYNTLKAIKEMGYDGVEFAGLYGNKPEDIKKMLDEIGLVAVSAHVPFRDMRQDPAGVLADYKTLGCEYVAVPYLVPEDRPGTGDFKQTIKDVEVIGKAAKEIGIQLLYHNHDFEFELIDGKYALDLLYESVSSEYLQTELDLCWVNVGGENPAEYLLKYSGRAPIVHLKDFVGSKSDDMYELIGIDKKVKKSTAFELRPVGYGVQDWYTILNACEEAGAKWVVVEQDRPAMEKTPLESIKMSREYLKTLNY